MIPDWLNRLPACPHCGKRTYATGLHVLIIQGISCVLLRYQRGCNG